MCQEYLQVICEQNNHDENNKCSLLRLLNKVNFL